MIDHIVIPASDVPASKAFYSQGLAPLGYQILFEETLPKTDELQCVGFGVSSKLEVFISKTDSTITPLHLAFNASTRSLVDSFYAAAMASGGHDNGKPALCPEYHADYYGAFVLDPDGHNIEAVCHEPEPSDS
jgi:catechol 2,3-dioxygenase-like lactoylglutathione lyase family enzyme